MPLGQSIVLFFAKSFLPYISGVTKPLAGSALCSIMMFSQKNNRGSAS